MKIGNLTEPVWKRSVYRQLNMEVSGPAGHYGADCVGLSSSDTEGTMYAASGALPGFEGKPEHQVTAVVNALAVCDAKPRALMIQAMLPQEYEEAQVQQDMRRIGAAAQAYGMDILNVCASVSAHVSRPQYMLTGIGAGAQKQALLQPGQELVVTKWIGLAGSAALAVRYEEELHTRYPFSLIDRAKEYEKLMGVEEEARAISHFGACAMHNLSQGGIFTGLWEMAERAGVGLEVDLKKIPVRQETIEICEYFDINPYYFYSAGALLVGTYQAEALIAELASVGVAATVIGRVTDGKERVILNGEDRRYLDRPQQEEWYRKIEN